MGRALLSFACALALALLATRAGAQPTRRPGPPGGGLDACLGTRVTPLDGRIVARTWRALAAGKRPPPLPALRARGAGPCVTSWWTPVVPEGACGDGARWRLVPMADAGTLIVDRAAGAWRWRDARDEVLTVGDALLVRPRRDAQRPDGGRVKLVTPTGERALPGFPEAVAGARAVVHVLDRATSRGPGATNDTLARVIDTRTMRTLFPLAPRPGDERNVGAAVIGAAAIGGHRHLGNAGAEAFAVDAATGAPLAVVADAWPARVAYPQLTSDGGVVLAAWHAGELEVALVAPGARVLRRTIDVSDIEGERGHAGVVIAHAAGDTVAVGLGRHLVVMDVARPERAPVRIATGAGPQPGSMFSLAGLHVHEGARVVSYPDTHLRYETVVVDARDGKPLARGDALGFVTHPQLGRVLALEDVRATDAQQRVLLVRPDGSVVRGPMGTARVGRFDVRTFAGAEEPLACDARALSILPPLLAHPGPAESEATYVLPAELVR